jgi:hypothetical protein
MILRPPDWCRILPWKIRVKVERPQRSEDVRCDTRSHEKSECIVGRFGYAGCVAPGQCSGPVPSLTCAAGNGGVRSSGGQAQGVPSHPGPTGEGEDRTGERE